MNLLRALLQPRSIAIAVDAGESGAGHAILANVRAAAPAGGVQVVARPEEWDALNTIPDIAILCTRPDATPDALDRAGKRGLRAAIVCTEDPEGRSPGTALKRALHDVARRHGCRFVGPGSAGVNLPAASVNASWIADRPIAGRLALVTQSNTLAASATAWACARGIGMSRIVTVGDESDLGIADVLDALAADARTQAILLHVHALANGRAFLASARAAARVKPILVLRPARVSRDVDAGAEARREAVLEAAFGRAGLLRVYDTEEWFEAAASLSRPIRRHGGKLAIVGNGVGPAMLAAAPAVREDLLATLREGTVERVRAIASVGSTLNPLALPPGSGGDKYVGALTALASDPGVATAVVVHSPSPEDVAQPERGAAIAAAIADFAAKSDLQISACWFGASMTDAARATLAKAGVSMHELPEQATRAFIHRERHRRNQETLRQVPASQRQQIIGERTDDAGSLRTRDESESEAFLALYGRILHATQGETAALDAEAADALLEVFGLARAPKKASALPLTFAIEDDADFGRIVVVDAGGDRRVALPPLNRELTRDLAAAARSRLLALGVDVSSEAIQDAAIRVAEIACDLPEVVSMRIGGAVAAGGGLVFRPMEAIVAPPEGDHLSIHPYPRELEERLRTKDGRDVLLRPIRIEDVRLYREMLDRIPADDLFMRFCNRYNDIAQAIPTDLLANLVRFDYSRDMTFVALAADAAGKPEALGVVDAFVSPGGETAEFSILVRTDLAGSGLGKTLMLRIIDYCRAKEVATLYGLVLRKNPRMLGLAKRLGFERVQDDEEEDEDMVKVVLAL